MSNYAYAAVPGALLDRHLEEQQLLVEHYLLRYPLFQGSAK